MEMITGEAAPTRAAGPHPSVDMRQWSAFVDELTAEMPSIVERVAKRLVTEVPSYKGVPTEDLVPIITTHGAYLFEALSKARPPAPEDDIAPLIATGESRAQQGIELSDLLHGWRIGTNEVMQAARRILDGYEDGDILMLRMFEYHLPWVEHGMAASTRGHRLAEMARVREAQQRVSRLVHGVLFGDLSYSDLNAQLEAFGLDPTRTYHVVRARPTTQIQAAQIESALHPWSEGDRRSGALSMINGDVCGFVAQLPRAELPFAVGVSPPVRAQHAVAAFTQATRVLDTALAFGLEGIRTLTDVGIDAAIVGDAEVGQALIERYIAPIEALGASSDDLLATVENYLQNDARLDRTATDMFIHVNTARYRLSRFEEICECSLRNSRTRLEVWWALRRRVVDNSRGSR